MECECILIASQNTFGGMMKFLALFCYFIDRIFSKKLDWDIHSSYFGHITGHNTNVGEPKF